MAATFEAGKAKRRGSSLVVSDVGMSAIEISIPQLLSNDDTSIQEIVLFQREYNLECFYVRHKILGRILPGRVNANCINYTQYFCELT